MIISGLFGNETAEKVLLYLNQFSRAYPREIALFYSVSISPIQRQLERFEHEGILISFMQGKTRIYEWNPRCFYKDELKLILEKAFHFLPKELKEPYLIKTRQRPRRTGKPL